MARDLQLAIVLFDKMTTLDAIGPYDVLQLVPNVKVVFVSHRAGPYKDLNGALTLNATAAFDEVPNPDIVLVPGGLGVSKLMNDGPFLDWIRKVHEGSLYTTSVCTGSLLLGAAGLLKGLRATTHWNSLEKLTQWGATPSGDRVIQEGKIITAAGVSSGIDMALKLVSLIADDKMSKTVQLIVEYDPQPPFSTGSPQKAGPEIVKNAQSFMAARSAKAVHSDGRLAS